MTKVSEGNPWLSQSPYPDSDKRHYLPPNWTPGGSLKISGAKVHLGHLDESPLGLAVLEEQSPLAKEGLKAGKSTLRLWRTDYDINGPRDMYLVTVTVGKAVQPMLVHLGQIATTFPNFKEVNDYEGTLAEYFGAKVNNFLSLDPGNGQYQARLDIWREVQASWIISGREGSTDLMNRVMETVLPVMPEPEREYAIKLKNVIEKIEDTGTLVELAQEVREGSLGISGPTYNWIHLMLADKFSDIGLSSSTDQRMVADYFASGWMMNFTADPEVAIGIYGGLVEELLEHSPEARDPQVVQTKEMEQYNFEEVVRLVNTTPEGEKVLKAVVQRNADIRKKYESLERKWKAAMAFSG